MALVPNGRGLAGNYSCYGNKSQRGSRVPATAENDLYGITRSSISLGSEAGAKGRSGDGERRRLKRAEGIGPSPAPNVDLGRGGAREQRLALGAGGVRIGLTRRTARVAESASLHQKNSRWCRALSSFSARDCGSLYLRRRTELASRRRRSTCRSWMPGRIASIDRGIPAPART